MAFRVRDLVINVVPRTAPCQGESVPIDCDFSSCQGISDFCDFMTDFDPCGIATPHCNRITFGGGGPCRPPTHCVECTLNVTRGEGCDFHCTNVPSGLTPPLARSRPQELAAVKEQLRRALAEVEAREKATAERMQPQTVEEVEQLEEKLTEALDELRQRKKELKSKEGGG